MSDFLKIWLPLILLIILSFFLTYLFTAHTPKNEISIATGREDGAYYEYALQYQKLLQKEGVKLNILTTAGSVESLELLKNKKVDLAFLQGGIVNEDSKKGLATSEGLHALASIYYEPVWIFYRGEPLHYLSELTDKRVSIGEIGSGVRPIALELLQLNGIQTTGKKIQSLGLHDSMEKLKANEIDLFFTIASPTAPAIKNLLADNSIQLMHLKRANAYRQHALFYKVLTLSEGSIDLKRNIPQKETQLLAKTAFLAANGDIPARLERLILRKAKQIHSQQGVFEELNEFPNQENLEIPIGQDAKRYLEQGDTFLEKIFPYHIAQQIDRFKLLIIPILTLLIPFAKGALPLFRWTIRRKIYKWYKRVNLLDHGINDLNKEELLENKEELEQLLIQVKEETNVPLSYMNEYYNLMLHIDMSISQIEKRVDAL